MLVGAGPGTAPGRAEGYEEVAVVGVGDGKGAEAVVALLEARVEALTVVALAAFGLMGDIV